MRIKRIILLYFFVFVIVTAINPTVSSAYSQSQEDITQYIIDISKDIYNSIPNIDPSILYSSKGEVKLKLFLSPSGEKPNPILFFLPLNTSPPDSAKFRLGRESPACP